jgi:hypothetical protein
MQALLGWSMLFACASASAAGDAGVVTLVDAGARVLRGATWYKLVPGARLEEADIVETPDRAQVQLEAVGNSTLNVVGPGTLHVVRAAAADAPATVGIAGGWIKAVAKPPGVRLRTARAEIASTDGIVVARMQPTPEVYVEGGSARLIELAPNGTEAAARDAKRGEHWSKPPNADYSSTPRAPKGFVDAMPRHYTDSLPSFAARYGTPPTLVADREITYAEAQPWLASRDRAAFEKRFASRLRDPAFRRAVEPHIARYPSWDRMLHPEKYAPKPQPTPAAP